MENTERKFFQEIGQKPRLFYVIFGFEGEMAPSKTRHRFERLPEGIDLRKLDRPEHSEYLDGFLDQFLGKFLEEKGTSFADSIRGSKSAIVLQGEVAEDRNLEYLRNVVGLIESMLEKDATGVLDLFCLKWMDAADWKSEYFSEVPENLLLHVVIIVSDESNGVWLHTRGMIKFGRPDISIRGVPGGSIDQARKLVNRLIGFHIAGGLLDVQKEVKMEGVLEGLHFRYVNDPENADFNNVYFDAKWPSEIAKA